jgi:hypothetical protein
MSRRVKYPCAMVDAARARTNGPGIDSRPRCARATPIAAPRRHGGYLNRTFRSSYRYRPPRTACACFRDPGSASPPNATPQHGSRRAHRRGVSTLLFMLPLKRATALDARLGPQSRISCLFSGDCGGVVPHSSPQHLALQVTTIHQTSYPVRCSPAKHTLPHRRSVVAQNLTSPTFLKPALPPRLFQSPASSATRRRRSSSRCVFHHLPHLVLVASSTDH